MGWSNYDSWRTQTPEEYYGTEGMEMVPCGRCGLSFEDHDERCDTCENDECGDCDGKGCEYEVREPDFD